MASSDFYLFFSSNPGRNESFAYTLQGSTVYGNWTIHSETQVIKPNQDGVLSLGLASDRKNSQYRFEFKKDSISISQEKFGISPIYYYANKNEIHVSSNLFRLSQILASSIDLHISKRYLLEHNLFNYSLFDNTIFEEIKLLPAFASLHIKEKLQIQVTDQIEKYFTNNPLKYKKCITQLTELFIAQNTEKIKDDDFISFTSGFDGRSLLSLAMSYKRRIFAYSFGTKSNLDLYLPMKQAADLKIPFSPIALDEPSYLDFYLNEGKNAIRESALTTNYLQLHWPYAAGFLSRKTNTIVTGMFGSELFRAAHLAGQLISPALVDYFRYFESDIWISRLLDADSLKFLHYDSFKLEMEALIQDLKDYKQEIIFLSESQRLYKFIYEETFRKFFGMQFILPMRNHVDVINPYLDWEFFKALLQTELAGVNNDFFTENPLKRFKGQLFYAELIRQTSPSLYHFPTGKGYSPADLHHFSGKMNIAFSFISKRLNRKFHSNNLDNLGILTGIKQLEKINYNAEFKNKFYNLEYLDEILKSGIWEHNELKRDKAIETISSISYLNDYSSIL